MHRVADDRGGGDAFTACAGCDRASWSSDLRPNPAEIDDARFFSPEEMAALGRDETWSGAIAIARKALDPGRTLWPNDAALSDRSGVDVPDRWRIWM